MVYVNYLFMFQNDYKRLGHSVICSIDYWLLYVNRKFKWYELSGSEMRNMFILFSWQCVWNYRESEMRNMFILFSWQCVWNYRDQKWEICSFCSLDNVCEIVCITYCCLKLLFCVMFPLLFHVSTTVLSWLPLRFSLTLINQVLNITVILRL